MTFDTNQVGDVARQSKSASDSYLVPGKQMTYVEQSTVLMEQRPRCPDIYLWYLLCTKCLLDQIPGDSAKGFFEVYEHQM